MNERGCHLGSMSFAAEISSYIVCLDNALGKWHGWRILLTNTIINMVIGGEEEELVFDEETDEEEKSERIEIYPVVGMVITDRMVKFLVLRDLMASIWRPGKGISIKEMSEKRYLFTFYHIIDMERVFGSGPWLFKQNLLVLRTIRPRDIPLQVP
ncbi:unnamed protein product, partial [Cuscuta europaea]